MAKTYNELYLSMRRALKDEGIEDFALEARRLLALASGYSDAELIARFYLYAGDEAERRARDLLRRRLRGEPLAYIAGSWEFYGLKLLVNPSVLIPRMDTEVLVSTALELLRTDVPEPRILDLCCGSGCIGCALAHELPNARVYMADISPEALSVARKNVALHHLNSRCVCLDADALSPPPLRMSNFDMIACNPPYISARELKKLDPSVSEWEPMLALDGGEDGLNFYRSVLEHWKSVLRDDGYIIFEVGEGQADSVRKLLAEAGFYNLGCALDTIGVERVIYGKNKKKRDK
ncbi:MAG: peptide chain release factor N(5)-glutamine methyltransferase [Oscillospiraceae bacterium]|nr:peptide chain release factor N(5)-glutamine methyltransferase [Oscillospiraceae bacterium]